MTSSDVCTSVHFAPLGCAFSDNALEKPCMSALIIVSGGVTG